MSHSEPTLRELAKELRKLKSFSVYDPVPSSKSRPQLHSRAVKIILDNMDELIDLIDRVYAPLDIVKLGRKADGLGSAVKDYVRTAAEGVSRFDIAKKLGKTKTYVQDLLVKSRHLSVDTTVELYKAIWELKGPEQKFFIPPHIIHDDMERCYAQYVLSEDIDQLAAEMKSDSLAIRRHYLRFNPSLSFEAFERILRAARAVRNRRQRAAMTA